MVFMRSIRGSLLRSIVPRRSLPTRRFSTIVVERDSISVSALSASFPFSWLRDSCQCPACVHPSTRQKLHRSSDFAHGVSPAKAEAVDGGLRVSWSSNSGAEEKEHESFYTASFLAQHASPSALFAFHRDVSPEPWTAAQFASRSVVDYSQLDKSDVLLDVYKQLRRDGLVFFSGLPTEETSDEKCELRKLATRLSVLRRTFYGETWDVMNIRNSKNIAYTNLYLGLHMDLLYFKEPPRYQILHALRNRVRGGQSLFVDALHAAQRLQASHPEAFEILANTPVPYHYINDGHHLHHSHPTFEVSHFYTTPQDGSNSGSTETKTKTEIASISYSPPFQAPLPVSTPREFYESLVQFVELLEDPGACVTRLLREGDAVIFDNRRVLHARAGFEEIEGTEEKVGETSRWLKGCYLEEDPVLDRMRVLSEELEK